jgi:hypothetical protein
MKHNNKKRAKKMCEGTHLIHLNGVREASFSQTFEKPAMTTFKRSDISKNK